MTIAAEIRFALRQLVRTPFFTLSAIVSLSLGLGVNTVIFGIASGLLLQLPPPADPEALVRIYNRHHSPFTYDDYRYFKEHARSFTHLVVESPRMAAFSTGPETERALVSLVSGDYFPAMGIRPALGTFFVRDRDDVAALQPEAVVSHTFWRSRLGGDPEIVGRTVRLNGAAFTVLGVAPEGFTSSLTVFAPDVWVPLGDTHALVGAPPSQLGGGLYATARLKPGVTTDRASTDVKAVMRQLATELPETHEGMTVRVDHARGVNAEVRDPVLAASGFLLAVALLVLLVACANVGNLLLARNAARKRELGIRLAIGASRARVVRQLLVELGLLAVGGAWLAVLLGAWTRDFVRTLIPAEVPITIAASSDASIATYAIGLVLLTVLIAGLAPSLGAVKGDVASAIREHLRGGGGQRSRLRTAFLLSQITLSTVLLAVALLFTRGLGRASSIDPGYSGERVLDISAELTGRAADDEAPARVVAELLRQVQGIPGVTAATAVSVVPLAGTKVETTYFVEGRAARTEGVPSSMTQFATVGPAYFETLGIDLLEGRGITDMDRQDGSPVAVVNEAFARRVWPGQSAIGRRFSLGSSTGPWLEVVGVARTIKYNSLSESPQPHVYLPFSQFPQRMFTVQARLAREAALASVRDAAVAALRPIDPTIAPPVVQWLDDDRRIALLPAQVAAAVLGAFGLLATVLAAIGIFGVAAYAVAQRTREIGVRTALGARAIDVLRTVLAQTARTVAIGAALGIAGALAAGRLLTGQLYGLSPGDPVTFLGVTLLLGIIALAATFVPARRAVRVDPVVALRSE
jgi:putative ABC transport system permease protein